MPSSILLLVLGRSSFKRLKQFQILFANKGDLQQIQDHYNIQLINHIIEYASNINRYVLNSKESIGRYIIKALKILFV